MPGHASTPAPGFLHPSHLPHMLQEHQGSMGARTPVCGPGLSPRDRPQPQHLLVDPG